MQTVSLSPFFQHLHSEFCILHYAQASVIGLLYGSANWTPARTARGRPAMATGMRPAS